jgi:hypothetical protein
MGGVNFTRNRAWWHTAVWDEYGQRHQYMALFPTFMFMIPMYWYGTFVNRELEQNFAAKMYQLEFENRRNRLTHNLIMEHFETHVEKVQNILDEVRDYGFEKAFEYEINNPLHEKVHENKPVFDEELQAEIQEFYNIPSVSDVMVKHADIPLWERQIIQKDIVRRKNPYSPYRNITQIRSTQADIQHTHVEAYENDFNKNE